MRILVTNPKRARTEFPNYWCKTIEHRLLTKMGESYMFELNLTSGGARV